MRFVSDIDRLIRGGTGQYGYSRIGLLPDHCHTKQLQLIQVGSYSQEHNNCTYKMRNQDKEGYMRNII